MRNPYRAEIINVIARNEAVNWSGIACRITYWAVAPTNPAIRAAESRVCCLKYGSRYRTKSASRSLLSEM
jgi:hypothetical protein